MEVIGHMVIHLSFTYLSEKNDEKLYVKTLAILGLISAQYTVTCTLRTPFIIFLPCVLLGRIQPSSFASHLQNHET